MNRRRFLTACIATIAAPAIVRAESLMPVRNRTITELWFGIDWGASVGDQSGLVMLQQAQNAIDRAMMDNLYLVVHPNLIRDLENMRPDKVWSLQPTPQVIVQRSLPRTP